MVWLLIGDLLGRRPELWPCCSEQKPPSDTQTHTQHQGGGKADGHQGPSSWPSRARGQTCPARGTSSSGCVSLGSTGIKHKQHVETCRSPDDTNARVCVCVCARMCARPHLQNWHGEQIPLIQPGCWIIYQPAAPLANQPAFTLLLLTFVQSP